MYTYLSSPPDTKFVSLIKDTQSMEPLQNQVTILKSQIYQFLIYLSNVLRLHN